MKHYIKLTMIVESDDTLEQLQETLPMDIECALLDELTNRTCKVLLVQHDKDLAAHSVRDTRPEFEVLNPRPSRCVSQDVVTVCELYHIQLPKQRPTSPEWRVPKETCRGYVNGIPGLRGKLVLTNGIKAFIVKEHESNRWCDIHHDFFIADDIETVPEEYRYRKVKKEDKPIESLSGF